MSGVLKIEKYGVILSRLAENNLELVRVWRNSPQIMQYSNSKEHISPETHRKWFDRMNNAKNLYFIIEIDGKPIGSISIKDIDYEKMSGESGIFIYEDAYLMGDVPFRAYFALHDYFFEDMRGEIIYAHILRDNKRAIRFNKFLGLELLPEQDYVVNQLYILTRKKYFERRSGIISVIC